MKFKTISFEVKQNGVALVTLNRPASFNAINLELATDFHQALQVAEQDDSVRVLVVTGSGKAFCAGGDLAWLTDADSNLKKREILDNAAKIIKTLNQFEKPVIAAVNGVVAGAGTAVAMACDLVIASEKASFAPNFVHIAAVPDSGASWYLPRVVGYQRAAELMFTGRMLSAVEARELGIYNRVVTEENLMAQAMGLAEIISAGPQRALRYIKRMLKLSPNNSLDAQLETEASLQMMAWSDSDFQEGVKAFLEKRKPHFK